MGLLSHGEMGMAILSVLSRMVGKQDVLGKQGPDANRLRFKIQLHHSSATWCHSEPVSLSVEWV